jgi:hypothetical protein
MTYNEQTARDWLVHNELQHFVTGSREICNPPVLDTDIDFVVLDPRNRNFSLQGWIETTDTEDTYGFDAQFSTYRSGDVNLIVVDSKVEFMKWRVATAAAKHMNILDKQDRINLFQGVLYGNWE